jgi:tRNA(fMet)-specific endonuclease VapC
MRYLLDTDHLSVYQTRSGQSYFNLARRLANYSLSDFAISMITVQEQLLGAHAYVNQAKRREDVVRGYRIMSQALKSLKIFEVLDFDDAASLVFEQFNVSKMQLGVMDARIAAIALSQNLTLLTRNQKDFNKVPGLQSQDWTANP